jgi:hypothetical protein
MSSFSEVAMEITKNVEDLLDKPFDAPTLLTKVAEFLEGPTATEAAHSQAGSRSWSEQLPDSEEVIEHSLLPMFRTSPVGRLLFANRTLSILFGFETADFLTKTVAADEFPFLSPPISCMSMWVWMSNRKIGPQQSGVMKSCLSARTAQQFGSMSAAGSFSHQMAGSYTAKASC